MRTISLSARQSINAAADGFQSIVLVRISHPDWDADVLLASDYTRVLTNPVRYVVISNGETYYTLVMSLTWPDDQDGQAPSFQMVFAMLTDVADAQGVDLEGGFAGLARSISAVTPASVAMSLIFAGAPDDIETTVSQFVITSVEMNAERMTLDVSREPIHNRPWPASFMTPDRWPGLFG